MVTAPSWDNSDLLELRALRRAQWAAQVQAYRASVILFQDAVRRYSVRRAALPSSPALPGAGAAQASRRDIAPSAPIPSEPATGKVDSCPLTERQREVAVLIARGCTNQQIAAKLVITSGTAANHVRHILQKLGFQCRAQIAAWAVQQELLDSDSSH